MGAPVPLCGWLRGILVKSKVDEIEAIKPFSRGGRIPP